MQSLAYECCKRLLMKNNVLGKRYSCMYTKQVPIYTADREGGV